MNKKKVQEGVATLLFWILVPAVAAVALGYVAERYLPWLNRWAGASVVLALAALLSAWRSKPAESVGWVRIAWLLASLGLFGVAGYIEWQHLDWPISPWVGAGVMALLFVGGIVAFAYLRGGESTQPQGSTSAHAHGQVAQMRPGTQPTETEVRQQIWASFGFPGQPQASFDVARMMNAFADQAIANGKLGDAAIMEQANRAVELDILKPEMLTDRACELCGIKPKVAQSATQSPRTQPERPQENMVDWKDI